MWPTTHTTHLGNSNENVDGRKGDPYSHIFVSNPNFKMALNIVFSFWARNACAFIRELTDTATGTGTGAGAVCTGTGMHVSCVGVGLVWLHGSGRRCPRRMAHLLRSDVADAMCN